MSVDQTAFFKARAKTLNQKKLKEAQPEFSEEAPVPAWKDASYKSVCSFAEKIRTDAVDFQHRVISSRRDYLTFNTPSPPMSNEERDEFDQESKKDLMDLSNALDRLSARILADISNEVQRQHLRAVVDIMRLYVKQIAKTVTSMRQLRIRNEKHMKTKMSFASLTKVYRDKRKREEDRQSPEIVDSQVRRRHHKLGETHDYDDATNSQQRRKTSIDVHGSDFHQREHDVFQESGDGAQNDEEISAPEKAQLVVENERIFAKFAQTNVEMDRIESQIVELQNLQDTFSEKLTNQEQDIDILHDGALKISEDLSDGNEWIRQAISNSASRRIFFLFGIVVFTVSLLFLDWYNP